MIGSQMVQFGLFFAILVSAAGGVALGQEKSAEKPSEAESNIAEPELAKELKRREVSDQAVRHEFMEFMLQHGGNVELAKLSKEEQVQFEKLQKQFHETDKSNREFLRTVIEKHGWPGKSLVGKSGSDAAFLYAQHADEDTEFQKLCLEKMKAMPQGEVRKDHIAMLTDRVLIHEGKPQRYGSQLTFVDGKLKPQPMEDEANVDARRKEMDLMPMAQYIQMAEEMMTKPKKN